MNSMQPSTSKAAANENGVANLKSPRLRYECLHLKEIQQIKASLGLLKTNYGDILIKTTNLIQKLTELEERVKKLEASTKP